jgi:transcriptional regulator with XRE-family HTH domain
VASSPSTTSNVIRLRLIMGLFRLSQRDVCRATGYSKAYVSQLLAGKQFGAGDKFWLRLNACLLDAIQDSASNVFDVAPMALPDP